MPPVKSNELRATSTICPICEIRPHIEHSIYCLECGKFLLHKKEAGARAVAMKKARSQNPPGFRCYCTRRLLELFDTKSPYYASFDHRTPGKKGDLVMCARWVNSMKAALSEEEFWVVVLALDEFWNGKPFPVEITRFSYWRGKAEPPVPLRSFRMLPLGQTAEACEICGARPPPRTKYCLRCGGFVYRAGENLARVDAMKRACRKGVFFCKYTGLALSDNDPGSPLYMEFDHTVPGKKGHLDVVAAYINRMKTDLSEEEFRKVIRELARFRRKGGRFRDVIRFEHWLRAARR